MQFPSLLGEGLGVRCKENKYLCGLKGIGITDG